MNVSRALGVLVVASRAVLGTRRSKLKMDLETSTGAADKSPCPQQGERPESKCDALNTVWDHHPALSQEAASLPTAPASTSSS